MTFSEDSTLELNFDETWARIQQATGLKNVNQLSRTLNIKQPAISRANKNGIFPLKWALSIAKFFKLNTDWVLFGTGPIRYGMAGIEETLKKGKRLNDVLEQTTHASSIDEYEVCMEVAEKLREELLSIEPPSIEEKIRLADARILELEQENKMLHEQEKKSKFFIQELTELQEWLVEISEEEPERRSWFKMELKDKFPLFKEWLKKRDQATSQAAGRQAA